MQIDTVRLILTPLSLAHLLTVDDGSDATLPVTPQQRIAIAKKIPRMQVAAPGEHPWLTYWLITVQINQQPVGLIGFKGLGADGTAEVGYGVFPGCEGQGFATEALRGLVGWAFKHPSCCLVTARGVLRTNIASQKVLEHNRFQRTGENPETFDYQLVR